MKKPLEGVPTREEIITEPLSLTFNRNLSDEQVLHFARQFINGENLFVGACPKEIVPFNCKNIDFAMEVTSSPNTYLLFMHGLSPLYILSKSYKITGDNIFLFHATQFLNDWVAYDRTTVNKPARMWSDHAVALRTECLIYYLRATNKDSDEEILALLEQHGKWLLDAKNYTKNHNHGIFQDAALYKAGIILNNNQFKENSLKRVTQQIRYAYPFEVHIENSMSYNMGMTNWLLILNILFNANESSLEGVIKTAFDNALRFLLYAYRPDLSIPAFGDTRGAKLGRRNPIVDYGSPFLSYISSKGIQGELPTENMAFFKDDGYAFVRSSFKAEDKDASWLMFKSGFNNNTHKHKDDLSICWFSKGRDILIDPGMYNYMVGNKYHDYLCSVNAHSSISVAGKNYYISENITNRAGLLGVSNQADNIYRFHGYNNLYHGIELYRDVIYVDENTLVLIDFAISEKKHCYVQNFHFHESINITSVTTDTLTATLDEDWNLTLTQLISAQSVLQYEGEKAGYDSMSLRSVGIAETVDTKSVKFFQDTVEDGKIFITLLQLHKSNESSSHFEKVIESGKEYLNVRNLSFEIIPKKSFKTPYYNITVEETNSSATCTMGGRAVISLLNHVSGRVLKSTELLPCNDKVVFKLESRSQYAIKRKSTLNGITVEELLGSIVYDELSDNFKVRKFRKRPFVKGQSVSSIGNNTFAFKILTEGFSAIETKWYIYRNGSSHLYHGSLDDSFEHDFDKESPGTYTVIFRITDKFFGEVAMGNFEEIAIK